MRKVIALLLAVLCALSACTACAAVYTDEETVSAVQQALAEAGYYSGQITGHMGSMTQEAVRRFQRDNGLNATGNINDAVLSLLLPQSGVTVSFPESAADYEPGTPARVEISEIGASNHCTFFDANGDTPDWVELHNAGGTPITLTGWRISDSAKGKNALVLDDVTLPAGGYALIEIGDAADWGLSASGETVYLFNGEELTQSVSFPAMERDVSYALIDGEFALTWQPTPGTRNRALAQDARFDTAEGLCFNEFLTSAPPYRATGGYDYLELTNTGKKLSMKGYTLYLGMAGSRHYSLPQEALSTGGCRGIYCTEDALQSAHTGFALPAQGALLSLWSSDGELVDFIRLPQQYANIPYGRGKDGTWGYFAEKSFGRANGTVYAGQLDAPQLSLTGGVYVGDSLTISITAQPGVTIRYTTNGDTPTASSAVYSEPITIKQTTALCAAAFAEGYLPSTAASATYVLGLPVKVPVVCMIVDNFYLYNSKYGLITGESDGKANSRKDWEYPAHVEYFDATGSCQLSQACGFGIQGNSSRGNKQKSFQLVARKSYGTSGYFEFNPFEDRDFTQYKSFNLRAAGSEGTISTRFRDAALSTLAQGTSLLYSAGQPVLVYLNGSMYGHYNLRERINKHFIAQHLGITDEDTIDNIDILCETGNVVHNGSNRDYKLLSEYMKSHDLNVAENLEYVLSQMDVQSYFEYVAFMMATGNRDLSNTRFYRMPGGKWTWLVYDLDRAMEKGGTTTEAFSLYTMSIDHKLEYMTDHVPFAALMKVPAMREQFLTTLGRLMAEKFTTSNLLAVIDAWHDKLAPIMPYHLSRWTSDTMHYWESLVENMRKCARARPQLVVQYTKKYFKLTDEEVQRYFGDFLMADAQ